MKRFLALLLTGSLLLTPALAADGTAENPFPALRDPASFSDVVKDSWYADAADLCYETGLMNGTGQGQFSPDATVTIAEAYTLAARIHHILHGGDGVLPQAPTDWGTITVTRSDGASFSFYEDRNTGFWVDGRNYNLLYWHVDESWTAFSGQAATVTISGVDYTGVLSIHRQGDQTVASFDPDRGDQSALYSDALWDVDWRPQAGMWYRDTAYYVEEILGADLHDVGHLGEYATRLDFVQALALVSDGLLDPINDITTFPDCEDYLKDTVLPFYQAGILNGVDAYGTFNDNGKLSRAEMATMAARLVRPELRLRFSLQTVDDSRYTLTPVDLKGGEASDIWATSSLLYVSFYDEAGDYTGWALYRSDGSWYTPDPGVDFLSMEEDGLVLLSTDDGSQKGVMDSNTWSFVLPFGAYNDCRLLGDGYFATYQAYGSTPVLYDRSGAVVAHLTGPAQWDVLRNGLAPCLDERTNLYGFVDTTGAWAIPPIWQEVKHFADGYAIVLQNDRLGVIDTTGKLVIPCQWERLAHRGGPLFYGSSIGKEDGVWLSADGQTVSDAGKPFGNWIITLSNGYFPCHSHYMDTEFQPVTPQIFDWTGPVDENGCGFVGKDGAVYRIALDI